MRINSNPSIFQLAMYEYCLTVCRIGGKIIGTVICCIMHSCIQTHWVMLWVSVTSRITIWQMLVIRLLRGPLYFFCTARALKLWWNLTRRSRPANCLCLNVFIDWKKNYLQKVSKKVMILFNYLLYNFTQSCDISLLFEASVVPKCNLGLLVLC